MSALIDAAQSVDSSVTEASLIERWGISVLLSDQERARSSVTAIILAPTGVLALELLWAL